jgi:hypothetical protein
MSTYTVADIRKMVDDLDDVIRASIGQGDIETVFVKERPAFVSKYFKFIIEIYTQKKLG